MDNEQDNWYQEGYEAGSGELQKWKETAAALYNQLRIADNCINYDQLGKHRDTLSKDISQAMKGYEHTKSTTP